MNWEPRLWTRGWGEGGILVVTQFNKVNELSTVCELPMHTCPFAPPRPLLLPPAALNLRAHVHTASHTTSQWEWPRPCACAAGVPPSQGRPLMVHLI